MPRANAADIPSLDRLLNRQALAALLAQHGRTRVTTTLRTHLQDLRSRAIAGNLEPIALTDDVAMRV